MFENKTYDAVLADAMAEVSDGVSKGEGSLVFNALSALAFEIEKLYEQMDYIIDQSHAETADLEHMILIAADRGITRREATHAYVKVVANVDLPTGWRASLKGYNYQVEEAITGSAHTYKAIVEETGSGANTLLGALIPIDYVEGLTSANVTELLIAGRDAETRDELYERYLDSFGNEAFGGNIEDYKRKVMAIDGVGGVKVYPVWSGAGTVKCVIVGADGKPASSYLVNQVQQAAQPTGLASGYGFAPIGHQVTIAAADGVTLAVTATITYASGASWNSLKGDIFAAVNAYVTQVRDSWAEGEYTDALKVYISRIEAAILSVPGVEDVASTQINSSGNNLVLDWDEVPILGTVNSYDGS